LTWLDPTGFTVSREESLYMRGWTREEIEKRFEEEAADLVDSLIYQYYIDGENVMFRCVVCKTFEQACDEAKSWIKYFSGRDVRRRAYKILNRYKKSDAIKNEWHERRIAAIEDLGWRVNHDTGELIEWIGRNNNERNTD